MLYERGLYCYATQRDTEAALLQEVCKDVKIEPPLIPSSELGDRSSLDVGARGLWSGLEKTLFDVRIFHPGAKSYQNRSLEAIYKTHSHSHSQSPD